MKVEKTETGKAFHSLPVQAVKRVNILVNSRITKVERIAVVNNKCVGRRTGMQLASSEQ